MYWRLKIVTNRHQYTKTTEDEEVYIYMFLRNAHPPIEKQSSDDWITPIHLENNSPSIKVPLIIWSLMSLSPVVG